MEDPITDAIECAVGVTTPSIADHTAYLEMREHQAQASNLDTDGTLAGNIWYTGAKTEEPVEHELQPIGTRIITSGLTGKDARSDARLD